MKLTVFAAGSHGDIQPCLALSRGLDGAGYQVQLAAPENFAAFVQQHDVNFFPLHGDVQQIMGSDAGRKFMENGGANPIQSVRAIRTMIAPVVMQMATDAYEACKGSDGLICLGVFSAFGQAIAEALNIPLIHVEPTPLLWTRAFPAPSWPIQQNLGGGHNFLSGMVMLQVIWQWYRPFINAFRQQLGLAPTSVTRFYRALYEKPMLSAYSPELIPRPDDWPGNLHLTGYFFLDDQLDWQPSPALQHFLDAGDPPVYIGFGSMGGTNPHSLADLLLAALEKSGQRGLILSGWGGLHLERMPESVFEADSVPHRWLFPRMAAVVHHGGAGTTAEGLRAGVPNVIVPFILDQPFWGARINTMGLGPKSIPHKKLTADRLAVAIQTAITDSQMRQRAQECGAAIRAENGVANAVQIVEQYLGKP
jgi:UDP:flavonoid glycosyltransferase YjiC (YdhE family)